MSGSGMSASLVSSKPIQDGLYSPALKPRMAELEAERVRLVAQLEAIAPAPPVQLHPNLPELDRLQVPQYAPDGSAKLRWPSRMIFPNSRLNRSPAEASR